VTGTGVLSEAWHLACWKCRLVGSAWLFGRKAVTMETMAVLERISGWMTGAVIPLMYITALIGIIEAVLGWAQHPLSFKGVMPVATRHIRERLSLPSDSEGEIDRVDHIQYLVKNRRELLFTGRPRFGGVQYTPKVRAIDQGGATLLKMSAPLWLCLTVPAGVLLFLGLAIGAFIEDGTTAGMVFLLVGAGLMGLLVWRIRNQIAMAPVLLKEVLHYIEGEGEGDAESA
jgi:hypothetical protein